MLMSACYVLGHQWYVLYVFMNLKVYILHVWTCPIVLLGGSNTYIAICSVLLRCKYKELWIICS
uniref:Uncharacterized protein n=1 Tax=Hordeum vulgare subsp. vulgare TaxID=112509 RepID=A0A8I6Z1V8_HORVV